MAIIPSIYRKLPFDALKDLAPVTQLTSTFLILTVNSSVPAGSVEELVALAKSQPGRLNYASAGVGSGPHLIMELFKLMTGTDIVHVPYKGTAPGEAALRADEVQVIFAPLQGILPYLKSGRLRALAVTTTARARQIPELPTMAEAGVRDVEYTGWFGLFAPAGTPREILGRVQTEIAAILAIPEINKRLVNWGIEPLGSTPEEFDAKYRSDVAKYARIVKEAHIPPQD